MKIFMTGTEGCVGSHLSEYLRRQGFDVFEFEGDIRLWSSWTKYIDKRYDFLIHLAAVPGVRRSFEEPEFYFDHNVNGTEQAFVFGRMVCKNMLYASSSNAYEWWANPYATTKKINETMARQHEWAKGMRFHTVWPGRDDMLYKKLSRNEVTYINANHYRDWIHVDDLCSAILTIMNNFSNITSRVVDIGTGSSFNVLEMAQKVFDWDGEIRYENPRGERVKTQADVKYLYDLGWKPEKDIFSENISNGVTR